MNFAFMSFSCPELSLRELLDLAESLGYDAVEPRLQDGHGHGIEFDCTPEQRAEIRATFDTSPIDLCCIAVSCSYADPPTCEQHVNDTHLAIDLAGDLDCKRLRVFGGHNSVSLSREAAIDQCAGALSSVSDHAAERGVTICLETHDDWRDPAHVATLMQQVNHPNIAVNWDIMHPIMAEACSMEEACETLKPWIRHVHVHDGTREGPYGLTLVPIGEGIVDHGAALKCLKDMNYDGYISGEWISWEPYDTHLPRELAALKALEESL